MKCIFCKEDCIQEDNDPVSEIWMCYNHPYPVKELISYSWGDCVGPNCCPQKHHTASVIMFGKYKVKFRHSPHPNFCVYAVDKQDPIFRLSFHPDITPENIKEKLHLWITFS